MTREDQLLVILCEEAGEVIQAATKALRWGLEEVYPETGQSNVDRLVDEMIDFIAVGKMLQVNGSLPMKIESIEKIKAKQLKVEKYLLHSANCGRLSEEIGETEPKECPICGEAFFTGFCSGCKYEESEEQKGRVNTR